MSPLYAGVGGVVRELTEMDAGINGVVTPLTEMWAGVDGVNRQIFSTGGTIYGAEWDGGSNPAWTRTDAAANFPDPQPAVNNGSGSSPFDDIMPWAGMEIVQDPQAGTLVSIPKYYYKWTRTGAAMKLQISPEPQNGFLVSPAHADRGDGVGERDVVYVGRYHCVATSNKSEGSGSTVLSSKTRYECRQDIHALGSTIWQYDFAMYWTIMMLYLVEYADWNSQAKIGYGCSPRGAKFLSGLTDSMLYHTGTTAANRTTYGCCQYRHIEGLWDNVFDYVDGIYRAGSNVYCIKNPANFSDTTGGTVVGTATATLNYTSAWTNPTEPGFEYALIPNAAQGSQTTYVCDLSVIVASTGTAWTCHVGGSYSHSLESGAFYVNLWNSQTQTSSKLGCRLMKLP